MLDKNYLAEITLRTNAYLARLDGCISAEERALVNKVSITKGITRLFSASQYAMEVCTSWPCFLVEHIKSGSLCQTASDTVLRTMLDEALSSVEDEEALMSVLRLFRHKQMLRILWIDINGLASMEQTMGDLSQLAECCIDASLQWLSHRLKAQFGTPYAEGCEQKMVVLGMGKLGGRELNFSSDVDLIFCYPSSGSTQGGSRAVENQWFFNRLGQSLIRVLDQVTVEGFVYRMDLRLRPYGSSGALTWSFSAMEQYYQDQGRDWERYALLKARPVAGDKHQGVELLKMLRPFIYRRYLDFSAIEALRDMKGLIHREVLQKGMQQDIKRGAGGIREIEFIVQSFQLIYGGRKRHLQSVSLLDSLRALVPLKFISLAEAGQLKDAYLFLRRFEHLVQAWQDKQTHTIPSDEQLQVILAREMGYPCWLSLLQVLDMHRSHVEALFSSLMSEPEVTPDLERKWQLLWERKSGERESIDLLMQYGFQQVTEIYQQLMLLRDGRALKSISRKALSRVNRFIPVLLYVCESQISPDQALLRTLPIVNKVLRRSSYLVLLLERPEALFHLVKLCHDSLWVAGEIAKYPSLMDEFLNPGDLYNPPSSEQLQKELVQQLLHISKDDVEARLESLCYFKVAHLLKSVVAQTNGYMPLMSVSNYLTWVAESVIREITQLAWHLMTEKYGWPEGQRQSSVMPFIVLGYGKLGGLEMGPGSDLDLVFIHNTDIQACTDGKRSLDHQTFFARFAQKVIHLLSTQTPLGKLYEVDVRLRPSGNSGLLVSSFTAFEKYQREAAWVWESQALIKARVITSENKLLEERFNTLRHDVLLRGYDLTTLQKEIKMMRKRMSVLDCSTPTLFDIKYGRGGIVDLEFFVQYLVLLWAVEHEALLQWTDIIRLLETLNHVGIVCDDEAEALKSAYLKLRATNHQRARQNQDNCVDNTDFLAERKVIIQAWNHFLSGQLSLDH